VELTVELIDGKADPVLSGGQYERLTAFSRMLREKEKKERRRRRGRGRRRRSVGTSILFFLDASRDIVHSTRVLFLCIARRIVDDGRAPATNTKRIQ